MGGSSSKSSQPPQSSAASSSAADRPTRPTAVAAAVVAAATAADRNMSGRAESGARPQRFPLATVVQHRVQDWSQYYLDTAANGDPSSMMVVAQMCLQPGGFGEIQEDRLQAVKWFQHACNAGSGEAIVVFSNLCRELLAATVVPSEELVQEIRALVKPRSILPDPAVDPSAGARPGVAAKSSVDAVSGQKLTLSDKRTTRPDDSQLVTMSSAEDQASTAPVGMVNTSGADDQKDDPDAAAAGNEGSASPAAAAAAAAAPAAPAQAQAAAGGAAPQQSQVLLRSVQAARDASRLGHYSTFVDVHNNRYRIPHDLQAASFAQLAIWCPLFSSLSDDDMYSCGGSVTPV